MSNFPTPPEPPTPPVPPGSFVTVTTSDGGRDAPWSADESLGGLALLMPILIVFIIFASKAFRTWTATRHGYPIRVRGEWVRPEAPEPARAAALMADENARLRSQVARLEERLSVVERIVTDPAARVSAEIDALR